jgi:hypothetical protein
MEVRDEKATGCDHRLDACAEWDRARRTGGTRAPAVHPIPTEPSPVDVSPAAPASHNTVGPFRTRVTLSHATSRAWLDQLGAAVLDEGTGWAVVLADADQLEVLARLRSEPRASDDLTLLVSAHAEDRPLLARALQPVVDRAAAVWSLAQADDAAQAQAAARDDLRAAMHAMTAREAARREVTARSRPAAATQLAAGTEKPQRPCRPHGAGPSIAGSSYPTSPILQQPVETGFPS